MYKVKFTFAAILAVVVAIVALTVASTASADPPTPVPGEPNCPGLDTATFAQDWKSFSFEPSGVGRLTRFYGGSPTDFTQSGRYDDCTP